MSDVEALVVDTAVPAPVEANPAEDSATAPEVATAPDAAKPEEAPKPQRVYTQDELDRILAKNHARTERKAERLGYEKAMREAAERQAAQHSQPAPTPVQGAGKPSPDQFKDWDSYNEALVEWKLESRIANLSVQARQARAQTEAEAKANEVRSKLAPGTEKYEDFEEVVLDGKLPITEIMAKVVLKNGQTGLDIAYYLGQNRSEAARISKLDDDDQVREMDKIISKLTKPPEPTKAPAPITPNAGTASVAKPLEELDYDEFVKRRRKQIAARR